MFRKKELVKEKALVEIEEFSDKMLEKINFSFDVMQEKDRYQVKCSEQEIEIKGLKKLIQEKEITIATLTKKNDQMFEYMAKLVSIVKATSDDSSKTIKELNKKIKELGSDKYKVVKVKPCRETKQKTKINSSAVESKIIKQVMEGK